MEQRGKFSQTYKFEGHQHRGELRLWEKRRTPQPCIGERGWSFEKFQQWKNLQRNSGWSDGRKLEAVSITREGVFPEV